MAADLALVDFSVVILQYQSQVQIIGIFLLEEFLDRQIVNVFHFDCQAFVVDQYWHHQNFLEAYLRKKFFEFLQILILVLIRYKSVGKKFGAFGSLHKVVSFGEFLHGLLIRTLALQNHRLAFFVLMIAVGGIKFLDTGTPELGSPQNLTLRVSLMHSFLLKIGNNLYVDRTGLHEFL